jgi:hypothetical protein
MSTEDGEPADIEPAVLPTLAEVLAGGVPQTGIRTISGFWRRFIAFVLDVIVLGIAGQLTALALASVLFEIGPYARIPGQLLVFLYFALMDSSLGDGKTVGKRMMRIAVRDARGQPIGIGRSMLRTSIWLIPQTLNGWNLSLLVTPIGASIATLIVFGVGGAVIATMIFNRRSRPGLHDMLTHTYVLHLEGMPVDSLPPASRRQWILSGVMLSLAVAVIVVGYIIWPHFKTKLEPITNLQHTLETDSRFFSVGVADQTFFGQSKKRHLLRINVWVKGVPTESQRTKLMNDIARQAVRVRQADQYDLLRIELTSAYDFGIASGFKTSYDGETVNTWRERIRKSSTSGAVR